MGRAPCCSKVGLHRGAWSDEEDKLLTNYIQTNGEGQWRSMPPKAGLLRCGKSCRLRWVNYLRPGLKRGSFTNDENDVIIRLHAIHGNRWSFIATELPGRTDNEIKNHSQSLFKRKLENNTDVNKKPRKKRKTDPKSTKVKIAKNPKVIVDQPASSSSELLSLRQDEINNNGLTCGASSSSIVDQGDPDLLEMDFDWPNWSSMFENMEDSLCMSGHDHELDMPLDGLDSLMMEHDESMMLEKLYDEYMQLLKDGDEIGM